MENIGRTNLGKILIFAWLEQDGERYKDKVILSDGKHILNEFYYFKTGEKITKHSKNIIDLIEVGDYVNGEKVLSVDWESVGIKGFDFINPDDIKTIITKEQIETMKYKVGD